MERARGPDRWIFPVRSRLEGDDSGSRSALRRRHRAHGEVQGLPLRHRRPSLFLQVEGGRGLLDANPAATTCSIGRALAHFLSTASFFSYPLKAIEALCKLGIFESAAVVLSYLKARVFPIESAELRGLGQQSVRQTAVQHLLQDLHGESLGHELQGNLRRLGRPAHQGPVADVGHFERASAARSSQKGQDQVIKSLIDSFRYPRRAPA